MVTFATKENLIQPLGKHVQEKPLEKDHVMGGLNILGILSPALPDLTDGNWVPYDTAPWEYQRLTDGEDTDWCVSFSNKSTIQIVHKFKYGNDINLSVKFLALGSGTVRGLGNGKRTVAEWQRTNGFALETECPYNPAGTMNEAYTRPDASVFTIAKTRLTYYEFKYQWLVDQKPLTIIAGLKKSPTQVDVEGRYVMNDQGYLINTGVPYSHEVDIIGFVQDEYWIVKDSETQQYLKFAWNYIFDSAMIHSIEKKNMNLYHKKFQTAIGLYIPDNGGLFLWRDGIDSDGKATAGGSVFKALGLTYSMATPCDEWPYPVKGMIGIDPITGQITLDTQVINS